MINYAHRGASDYAPENTLSSFYLGLLQGANGIETDVQITRDGVPVLFHDDTLDRVTDFFGSVCDYTYDELRKAKVTGSSVTGFYDRIIKLETFLEHFASYPIHFAIELKSGDAEALVIDLIRKFDIADRTTVTSFRFAYILKVKQLDPSIRIGWLVEGDGCDCMDRLLAIGGEEMAPQARAMTQESVRTLREAGLGVRAWGVSQMDLMKKMCRLEVDGMTVNFPDRLSVYLDKSGI
ncbi:MAG: hypothetical protein IKM13_07890 [Clostridia bacterium]|nr:hypothetical protein [Clostridia bacterium]